MGAYDRDFHAWTVEQAEAIRRRSANELDWDNLAEEIESLGRQQRWELRSRLTVLLTHLQKLRHQPGRRTRSWNSTIIEQRDEIASDLRDSPSLAPHRDAVFAEAYATARRRAAAETGLPEADFPMEPPFTVAQALDPEWRPSEA